MTLALEEVRHREMVAKKTVQRAQRALKKHKLLEQWYWCLGMALEKSGTTEPDFGFDDIQDARWLIDCDEAFAKSVIGDQLAAYGLELTSLEVSDGFDTTVRLYIGKPDQYAGYAPYVP